MESSDFLPLVPSILLAIVAIYGAILSTMNFFNQRKSQKPQLEVVFWNDVDTEKGEITDFHKYIIARNTGIKTVTLSRAYLIEATSPEMPWTKWINRNKPKKWPRISDDFKIKTNNELSSGKCYEIEISDGDLERVFGICNDTKIIAVFVDQLGNRYQSKPLRDKAYFSD